MDMEDIKKYFAQRDQYAKLSGIELLEVSPGRATAAMEIREHHLNGVRTVHGGAIFTLADTAFAAAANSDGNVALGVSMSICYTKAGGESGTLYARAEEVASSRRLGTYRVTITNRDGDEIAVFQGMVYRKNTPLPAPGQA